MFVLTNGKVIEVADIPPVETKITKEQYSSYVAMKIHKKYSVDDEIAIIRQKDEKPEEYAEYYAYCESVKSEVKKLIKRD